MRLTAGRVDLKSFEENHVTVNIATDLRNFTCKSPEADMPCAACCIVHW